MNANKQIVNSHSLITPPMFNHLYQYIHCTNVSIYSTWSVSAAITHWLCDWQDLSLHGFLYFPHLPSSCLLWTQFFGKSIQVPGLSEFGYLNQWYRIHQKLPTNFHLLLTPSQLSFIFIHHCACFFDWSNFKNNSYPKFSNN